MLARPEDGLLLPPWERRRPEGLAPALAMQRERSGKGGAGPGLQGSGLGVRGAVLCTCGSEVAGLCLAASSPLPDTAAWLRPQSGQWAAPQYRLQTLLPSEAVGPACSWPWPPALSPALRPPSSQRLPSEAAPRGPETP